MLTASLLSRSLGDASPSALRQEQSTRLLHALQPAPHIRFDNVVRPNEQNGGDAPDTQRGVVEEEQETFAHKVGVNALVVDRFEGR